MKYLAIPVLALALAAFAGPAQAGPSCTGADTATEAPAPPTTGT